MDMKAIIEDIVAEEEEAERLQRYGDISLGVVLIRYRPRFLTKLGIKPHSYILEICTDFLNGPSFRVGNFFTSKSKPMGRKTCLPRAVEGKNFLPTALSDFKVKFPYLISTAHSEIVFL